MTATDRSSPAPSALALGFLVSASRSGVEFHLCSGDTRSSFARHHGCSAAFMGHLYDRAELLGSVEIELAEDKSDAALALAIYCGQGRAGFSRLEGDFALVLWDEHTKQLVGCRDPLGGYPLFWTSVGDRVAFATALNPLQHLSGRRQISQDYLADFLMSPGAFNEGFGEGSPYQGIQRVLPGTVVSLDPLNRRVVRSRYWDWLEEAVDPGTDRLEEIGLRYYDLLQGAVRERLSGPTAAHLSGGMDSTTVCLLALDLVRRGVGTPPLHALALVYERLPQLAKERWYIETALERTSDALVGHRIASDELLDFDSLDDPPPHDEPFPGVVSLAADIAMVRVAAEVGSSSVLTGCGADELLAVPPFYLTDLLRRWKLKEAWTEASRWALARNANPWDILRPFGLANLFPAARHGLLGRALPGGPSSHRQNDWSIPPWIDPSFARAQSLGGRAREHANRMYRRHGDTVPSLLIRSIEGRTGDPRRWVVAAPWGVDLAHPFLDTRVLRFGLGMQARVKPDPQTAKPVLATAMRGVLPEAIRNRSDKRSFNEVFYRGLIRNLPRLQAIVADAEVDGFVQKAMLLDYLDYASLCVADPRQLQRLTQTMALIKWLSMQHEWQRRPFAASQVVRQPLDSHAWSAPPGSTG